MLFPVTDEKLRVKFDAAGENKHGSELGRDAMIPGSCYGVMSTGLCTGPLAVKYHVFCVACSFHPRAGYGCRLCQ